MTPRYDSVLVILSVVIAMLASFAALNFAGQVTTASGSKRFGWLAGGASVLGIGIWSMHFVGMLAFHLPVAIAYSLPLMLLSVGVAIAASLLALMVVSQSQMHGRILLTGGLLMGAAIAGMHYIGMASIHAAARVSYRPVIVALSVLIAILASTAALWLAFRFRTKAGSGTTLLKSLAAVAMGIAIAGMHYTAMAGAQFAPAEMTMVSGTQVLATDELGQAIAAGALLMIALALVGLLVDRKVLQERVRLTDQLRAQAHLLSEQKEELEVQAEELAERSAEQAILNDELVLVNESLGRALREAERAQKAEHDANLSRTRFLNIVSHELRTPIGAIGGYAQLLLMGLRGPLTAQQESDLRRIDANKQHVLRLINELLDLAKLEAGQMSLHLDTVELRETFEATRPMIEPQLMAKSITYSLEFGAAVPRVIGDPERLQQILINLLANSIKFTPPRGSITVSASGKDANVEIRVIDSGPGIPADKIGSLFTPFLQLGMAGEQATGTGLGLTISRELARAMGGELSVEDGGRGATFLLSLHGAAPTHSRSPEMSGVGAH